MIPSLALTGFHRDGRHALGSSSPRSITATTTASSTTSGVWRAALIVCQGGAEGEIECGFAQGTQLGFIWRRRRGGVGNSRPSCCGLEPMTLSLSYLRARLRIRRRSQRRSSSLATYFSAY